MLPLTATSVTLPSTSATTKAGLPSRRRPITRYLFEPGVDAAPAAASSSAQTTVVPSNEGPARPVTPAASVRVSPPSTPAAATTPDPSWSEAWPQTSVRPARAMAVSGSRESLADTGHEPPPISSRAENGPLSLVAHTTRPPETTGAPYPSATGKVSPPPMRTPLTAGEASASAEHHTATSPEIAGYE